MIRGLAFLVFLLVFTAAASAQAGHTISGKVRNVSGEGVSQAIVALESGNGALIGQVATTIEGDFHYSGLTENSYTLTVSAPDHLSASQQVRFIKTVSPTEPGETQFVEITLRPASKDVQPPASPIFVQDVPPAARKKFDEAMKLLKDKDTNKALAAIQDALGIFPDYFDARLSLAAELMKAGRLNDAIVELEKARKINSRESRLYEMFGMILTQKQMPDRAAQVLAEAVKLNPGNPQTQYLLATALIDSLALIDQGKSDAAAKKAQMLHDAEKALLTALDLSGKKMFLVHLQMARIYEKREQPKRAADELEKYLASSPNDKNGPAIRTAIEKLRAGH